eukprot:TRINITY_DN20981_c0_g1_i1.p1 TRINITY_DN20981_c0_g1~~TRINITY_DN20981_c0_g1_i1.p1  ORF type:complete len:146 (-),score=27.71 TRINITY_DN20981_c0_g1_i1:76-513(-)
MDWPPEEVDFNTKGYEQFHHVVTYAGQNDKMVKICRCWQSKRFPYCDDTHKYIIESGDNVGPFVARIRGYKPTARNVSANALTTRSSLPKQAAFFVAGFGLTGLGLAAISSYAKGYRLRPEVDCGPAASAPLAAPPAAGTPAAAA